jgi:hypothetical protein
MAVASLIVAILAIVISVGSVAYTRRQAVAAEGVTAIERKRLHAELTPELRLSCESQDADSNRVTVTVELVGPAGLDRIDEATVRIRDDMPGRTPGPGGALTQEQISEVIWGPYRIVTGLMDTDSLGRAHGPFPLAKNEPYPIPLERSFMPSWVQDPRYWRDQYNDKPVRLEITCRRQGQESWIIPAEVDVPADPATQVL